MNRREFIARSAAAGAVAQLVMGLPGAQGGEPARDGADAARSKPAKNLIFMVADGTSFGTMMLGDLLIQLRENRRAHWVTLMDRPGARRALVDTRSADGFVTDSSAAATAWATGELVNNGKVGLTPDGRMPTPILLHARQCGKATGLVTTCRVTHATPAGFACNLPTSRDDEGNIALQMIERGYDLLLGGGTHFFTPDVLGARKGASIVRTGTELAAWEAQSEHRTDPLFGVFASSHMSFDIDRLNAKLDEPSLAEMTRTALAHLARTGGANGFVVQVEGGRVDHGGHYNDAAGLIYDMAAFDDAIKVALDYVDSHPDTLLIVTTDHATANPGLTEYGPKGIEMFHNVLKFRHSFEWLQKKIGKRTLDGGEPPEFAGAGVVTGRASDFTIDEMSALMTEASGLELNKGELELLVRWRKGEVVDAFGLGNSRFGPIGSVLANHTAVAFLSPNHTADPVELTAIGPGAGALPNRLAINDVHRLLVSALDLAPAKPV